jgi:hypothetical protein
MWPCGSVRDEALQMQEKATSTAMQLDGLKGQMVAVVAPSTEDGQRYAVVSLAAAEAFPTGALKGVRLHWGAAPGWYRGWQSVPEGWSTDPLETSSAGLSVVCRLPSYLIHPP